jgi:hypothetical protein
LDEAGLAVPASLDVDEVLFEVDVRPVEGLEFAESEAGVECGGPDRAVGGRKRLEKRVGLRRNRDSFAAAADGWQRELDGGVGYDVAAVVARR